jgi:hypothetical protein
MARQADEGRGSVEQDDLRAGCVLRSRRRRACGLSGDRRRVPSFRQVARVRRDRRRQGRGGEGGDRAQARRADAPLHGGRIRLGHRRGRRCRAVPCDRHSRCARRRRGHRGGAGRPGGPCRPRAEPRRSEAAISARSKRSSATVSECLSHPTRACAKAPARAASAASRLGRRGRGDLRRPGPPPRAARRRRWCSH